MKSLRETPKVVKLQFESLRDFNAIAIKRVFSNLLIVRDKIESLVSGVNISLKQDWEFNQLLANEKPNKTSTPELIHLSKNVILKISDEVMQEVNELIRFSNDIEAYETLIALQLEIKKEDKKLELTLSDSFIPNKDEILVFKKTLHSYQSPDINNLIGLIMSEPEVKESLSENQMKPYIQICVYEGLIDANIGFNE